MIVACLSAQSFNINLTKHLLIFLIFISACKPSGTDEPKSPSIERIKTADIKPGPVRHDTLSPEQKDRIRKIQTALADADHSSLENWIEDFRRDEDPDREIAVYEAIAQAYTTFVATHARTLAQKQDALGLLLERSGNTEAETLKNYQRKVLTVDEAKNLLSFYTKAALPIQVRKE